MADIYKLSENHISKADRTKLESFASHTIAHGRATRWHWVDGKHAESALEVFIGGAQEQLAVRICRDGKQDVFCVYDETRKLLTSGPLERVLTDLENHFVKLHGEDPNITG